MLDSAYILAVPAAEISEIFRTSELAETMIFVRPFAKVKETRLYKAAIL